MSTTTGAGSTRAGGGTPPGSFSFVAQVEGYSIMVLDPNGTIMRWNRGAETMTGYSAGEAIGRNLLMLFREEELAANIPRMQLEQSASRGHCYQEGWRRHRDGSSYWASSALTALVNENGDLFGFLEITRDETKVKRAEERFRLVVESSPSAIILADTRGGITLVNSQAEKLFGYERSELIGSDIELLIPMRYRGVHAGLRNAFFKNPQARPMGAGRDLYALRKDGSEFPVEIGLNPLETADGTVILASIIDITERKLLEANRMKSEFLANMSHELRTPMNAILGFSEMLIDQKAGPLFGKQLEYLKDIHASGAHLLQLINNVLDIAKIESGRMELTPEPFSLRDLLDEVISVLKPMAEKKNIQITEAVSDAVGEVTLDKSKFRQILYNLLSNAIKFNREGGLITVQTAAAGSGHFLMKVTDTGIGIGRDDIKRLFMPFVQLDNTIARKHEGSGLGLALTRSIVELHGGQISVSSVPGQETTFAITLPILLT